MVIGFGSNAKALNKKYIGYAPKGWIIRLNKGEYRIPQFEEILPGKMIKINTIEDVKKHCNEIPLAVGAPANSMVYWYPLHKPQKL